MVSATIFADSGGTLTQMKTRGGWKSNNVPMECFGNSSSMKMNAAQRLQIVEDESSEKHPIEDINPCTQSPALTLATTTFDRNFKLAHGYMSTQNGTKPILNHSSKRITSNSVKFK